MDAEKLATEQEETARMGDVHGSGIRVDLRYRVQLSSHVPNDGCHRRDVLRVRNMEQRDGQSCPLRLEFCIFLRRHTVDLCHLLLAYSGCHSSPSKGDGGPQCPWIEHRSSVSAVSHEL